MFPLALLWALMLIRMMKYFQTEDESNNRKFHYKYLLIITNHLPFACVCLSFLSFYCISLGLKHFFFLSSFSGFLEQSLSYQVLKIHTKTKRSILNTIHKLYEWVLMTNIILLLNLRSKIEKKISWEIMKKNSTQQISINDDWLNVGWCADE